MKTHKNDYKIYTDLQRFANNTMFGKILKPFFKGIYHRIKKYLPYPRDFLLKKIPKGGVCAEIGAYKGVFSERILRFLKPKKLYLIDPWTAEFSTGSKFDTQAVQDDRYKAIEKMFERYIETGRIILLRKTSDEALKNFDNNFFDFLYIDGDHSYEQVIKDLENYYPKIKDEGYLCGDDYSSNHLGVVKAVNEFVYKHNLILEAEREQFILKKTSREKK